MQPKRTTFSAKGILNGMGREALCIVMGTRSKLPDGSAGKLLRLTVSQEPTDLPPIPRAHGEGAAQGRFLGG